MSDIRLPRIYIVGPTASGKTDLALRIHRKLKGVLGVNSSSLEVLSCDSVQVYRELVIGSARPSKEELKELKHHLVGHVSIDQQYTAGQFEADAQAVIDAQPSADPIVRPKGWLIVGGSGFYVQALKLGMLPVSKSNPERIAELEMALRAEGEEALYDRLMTWDRETAVSIAPSDHYRLLRALEIREEFIRHPEGLKTPLGVFQKLSQLKTAQAQFATEQERDRIGPTSLTLYLVPPSRDWHAQVLKRRATRMIEQGFIEEVRALIAEGKAHRPAMNSVGYAQMRDWIQSGEREVSEVVDQIVVASLKLAKKQRTWFNRDLASVQIDCAQNIERGVDMALEFLTKRLG